LLAGPDRRGGHGAGRQRNQVQAGPPVRADGVPERRVVHADRHAASAHSGRLERRTAPPSRRPSCRALVSQMDVHRRRTGRRGGLRRGRSGDGADQDRQAAARNHSPWLSGRPWSTVPHRASPAAGHAVAFAVPGAGFMAGRLALQRHSRMWNGRHRRHGGSLVGQSLAVRCGGRRAHQGADTITTVTGASTRTGYLQPHFVRAPPSAQAHARSPCPASFSQKAHRATGASGTLDNPPAGGSTERPNSDQRGTTGT